MGRLTAETGDARRALRHFLQRHAGFDAERKVAGIVGDHAIEAGHVEREIVAAGGRADSEFCSRAACDQRKFLGCGILYNLDDFFG